MPGHRGIKGNKEADKLDKRASNRLALKYLKIPFTDLREYERKKSLKRTKEIIVDEGKTKGTEYFNNYHNEKKDAWFKNKKLTREAIVYFNRCRSGHCNIPSSLSRVGLSASPYCHCGHEYEDLNHFLWQCPLYDKQRAFLVKKLENFGLYLPLGCTLIFSKSTATICNIVYKYFKNCNRKM